jgi:hypothetical protein
MMQSEQTNPNQSHLVGGFNTNHQLSANILPTAVIKHMTSNNSPGSHNPMSGHQISKSEERTQKSA